MKLFGKELTIEEEWELFWDGDLESYKEWRNSEQFDEVMKMVDDLVKEVAKDFIAGHTRAIAANSDVYVRSTICKPKYIYKLEMMKGDN